MNVTSTSRGALRELYKLLGPVPDAAFASVSLEKLETPEGLFDEKTPLPSGTALDNILPIIVSKAEKSDRYCIIDGCKRFLALKKNNAKECACLVFSKVLDPKSAGLLRIALNEGRTMHLRERLRFYTWLMENYSGGLCETLLDEAGLRGFELKPLAACAEDVIDAAGDGLINVRNAEDFSLMEQQDRKAFLELFNGLSLSQQTQREFLEWLSEIAFSRKISVSDLLKSEELSGIMTSKTFNAPQKIEAARDLVYSWKYPLYSGALKIWKQMASTTARAVLENEPSSRIDFLPSPAFEKNRLDIRISIGHARAAKEIFERLSQVPQSTWAQLIYPVEENS